MKTILQTGLKNSENLTISHDDNHIIIDCATNGEKFIRLEVDASEMLQAVKAHHALTRPKR